MMSKFSYLYNDLIYSLQQLISQPATRRSTAYVGAVGFTIVELLIVIVVIGILVAIVIVAYTGITNTAKENAVKADMEQVSKKLAMYKSALSPTSEYPESAAALESAGFKVSQTLYVETRNNVYYCTNGQDYAFGLVTQSGKQYYYVNGQLNEASGVSYGNTCLEVASSSFGATGYDWPGDGAGNGWLAWTQ